MSDDRAAAIAAIVAFRKGGTWLHRSVSEDRYYCAECGVRADGKGDMIIINHGDNCLVVIPVLRSASAGVGEVDDAD